MKSVVLLSFSVLFAAPALQARPVRWDFPRPQPQEGIPFADSKTGVLVWNGDGALDITVGRGDWWEHRGGTPWLPSQSYTNIVSLVKRGELDPQTGLGRIRLEKGGKTYEAELAMSFRTGVFAIRWPEGLVPRAKAIAAWDSTIGIETKPRVQARLKTLGYAPPSYRGNGDGFRAASRRRCRMATPPVRWISSRAAARRFSRRRAASRRRSRRSRLRRSAKMRCRCSRSVPTGLRAMGGGARSR